MSSRTADAELEQMLCFDLYAASRAMTAAYRPLLAPLGLTYPQYLVLTVLWIEPRRTVKQLSDTLQLDYGTLTPLLQRMQSGGLITRERSDVDERSVIVELTPAGRALRSRGRGVQKAIQRIVGMPAEQLQTLQQSLRELTEATRLSLQDV